MKGDFSRLTFDPKKQFTRVLMQQGRVQLDADWNEQAAILLHYLERLAADLIGPFGGPVKADGTPGDGFRIAATDTGFTIGAGRYYVDGILAENPAEATHTRDPKTETFPFLVYLDVWERHVTFIEEGSIREVALEGPDTATRAQVAYRVRLTSTLPNGEAIPPDVDVQKTFPAWVDVFQPPNRGGLKAKTISSGDSTDPCVASPAAGFRGLENQLYRVEIHTGGKAGAGATFKWSRDNGSVTFPIADIATDSKAATTTVTLETLGHEGRSALAVGDRVEIADGDDVSLGLLPVAAVDAERRQVTLSGLATVGKEKPKHPLLRRWDYGRSKNGPKPAEDGALPIQEGTDVLLEDGVQISFQPADPAHFYRAGDYWLIPARTATGDVEWPQVPDPPPPGQSPGPATLPPFGVLHRYAPLALVLAGGEVKDRRSSFKPMGLPIP